MPRWRGRVEDGGAAGRRTARSPRCRRPGHLVGEGGVHVVVRVDQARGSSGPSRRRRGRHSRQLVLHRGAVGADLLEAGGDDDQGLRAGGDGVIDRLRHGLGRHGDDGEIQRPADRRARLRAGRPRISSAVGLTGVSNPENPLALRLERISYPTFPGVREAPTTAMLFGFNRASNIVVSSLSKTARRGRRPAGLVYPLAKIPGTGYTRVWEL
jgi:hypothetical protein